MSPPPPYKKDESFNDNSDDEESDDSSDEEEVEYEIGQNRKRYQFNPYQISRMEMFYDEFPNHRREQREKLAREIGLDHKQVQYWLRIKRVGERDAYNAIRNENARLTGENQVYRYQLEEANSSAVAKAEEFQNHINELRLENEMLREKINSMLEWFAKDKGSDDD